MRIIFFGYITFILTVLVIGCSREEVPPPPPNTDSVTLNSKLQNAPISWINLKEVEIETLFISEENIYDKRISLDESIEAVSPTLVKMFGEHFVTMEYTSADVIALNKEGEPVHRLNGEFQRPAAIMSDGDELYIYDDGLKIIQVYDSVFTRRTTIPFTQPYYTQGSVEMNRNHIAFQRDEASGFRVSTTDRMLLSIAPKNKPDSTIFEAFPRIVPSGKHPGGFNDLLFSMNQNSDIAAAYPALPYLFIYKDFNHQHSIVLDAEQFETVENPTLGPFEPVFGEAVRVTSLMDHIYLLENGDVLLFSFGLLHHLKFDNRNKSYNHHRSYSLVRGDTGERIQSISSIDSTPDQPNHLYATGMGILIELDLPE